MGGGTRKLRPSAFSHPHPRAVADAPSHARRHPPIFPIGRAGRPLAPRASDSNSLSARCRRALPALPFCNLQCTASPLLARWLAIGQSLARTTRHRRYSQALRQPPPTRPADPAPPASPSNGANPGGDLSTAPFGTAPTGRSRRTPWPWLCPIAPARSATRTPAPYVGGFVAPAAPRPPTTSTSAQLPA